MKRLIITMVVICFVAASCGIYEQDFGKAITPDELTLSVAHGVLVYGDWLALPTPSDDEITTYGVAFTWKLK